MLLDKYPNCVGCPVIKYCGTMVASTLLCATDNYSSTYDNDNDNRLLSQSKIDEIATEISNEIIKEIDKQFEKIFK